MTITHIHVPFEQLEAGLAHIQQSPADNGVLHLIVARPSQGARQVQEEGELSLAVGLVGDNWAERPSSRMPGKDAPHPEMQLNIMNARAIHLISAGDQSRWPLAGDQLYVDLDLSEDNLPPGTRLKIGAALIEVTPVPHNGCKKFTERYGVDAVKFVNSPIGKQLHLRGINAKVIVPGKIQAGDRVKKVGEFQVDS